MFNKIYPFASIIFLEIGKLIEAMNSFVLFVVFVLQLTIGVLTILKIWKELKCCNRTLTAEEAEKEVKKKHPILTGIIQIFKK